MNQPPQPETTMFNAFLMFGAGINFATGNIICGSICLAAAMLRVMVTSK